MRIQINLHWIRLACLGVSACLVVTGCATPEANPPSPRADRGYADFYAEPPLDVYWKVEEWDSQKSDFRVIYSEYKPPPNGVLRLEFAPGKHRLRLTFRNLATEGPVEVELQIDAQKITPVR